METTSIPVMVDDRKDVGEFKMTRAAYFYIEAVDPSPWLGINFDSGNFRTDDPYRDLEKIAPYAVTAQIASTSLIDFLR